MSRLSIQLFGKLSARYDNKAMEGLDARKVQELLCYLLLYRDRPHPRESLANLFWSDGTTSQSKAYLRKTLWQLQTAFEAVGMQSPILAVGDEWVQLLDKVDLRLDVAILERAFTSVQGKHGEELDEAQVASVQQSVELYTGNLLEGWYSDWCIYERERLQSMYLMLLEKLTGYCEAQAQYELGIIYGTRILHYDAAHERTHQRLMRLHYLDGNRTAALRQFQLCATTLATELAVKPDEYTLLLYQQLCNDKLDDLPRPVRLAQKPHDATPSPWQDILVRLRHFHTVLADIQRQVSQEIQAIEEIVRPHR